MTRILFEVYKVLESGEKLCFRCIYHVNDMPPSYSFMLRDSDNKLRSLKKKEFPSFDEFELLSLAMKQLLNKPAKEFVSKTSWSITDLLD